MRIGVIGAGNVGTALAKRLIPAGHQVMLSYSRDTAKLASSALAFGASVGTPAEAAAFADVVALTVPWSSIDDALAACDDLSGKVVWDCTNALKPDQGTVVSPFILGGGSLPIPDFIDLSIKHDNDFGPHNFPHPRSLSRREREENSLRPSGEGLGMREGLS